VPCSDGEGIDVVESGFDVQEEGGDLQSRSLESSHLVYESETGIGGPEPRKGAALVRVEEAFGSSNGGQSNRHYSFEDYQNSFEEDDDTEGGGGVVGGLAGLV